MRHVRTSDWCCRNLCFAEFLSLAVLFSLLALIFSGCDKQPAVEGVEATDALMTSALCLSTDQRCVTGSVEFENDTESPTVAAGALVYVEGHESVSTRATEVGHFVLPLLSIEASTTLALAENKESGETSSENKEENGNNGKGKSASTPAADESFFKKPFTIVAVHEKDGKKFAKRLENLLLGGESGLDVGTLSLTETGAIEGRVTLEDGASALGVDVYIPGTSLVAKAAADGRFVILYVPEGEYSLVYEKQGYFYDSLAGVIVQSKQVARIKSVSLQAMDQTAPTTTITSGPKHISNQQIATFELESNEPTGGFLCRLDSGRYESCSSPVTFIRLGEGEHVLDVAAVDGSGNIDSVGATYRWRVDLSPPLMTVEEQPANVTRNNNATFRFATSDADATFHCLLDGGEIECGSELQLSSLAQGNHLLQVSVADAAGNRSNVKPFVWQVDLIEPDTIAIQKPAALSNSTSATILFTANKPSTFQCSYNGSTPQPCSSPLSYTGLMNGNHLVTVTAFDAAGSPDPSPLLVSWDVDAAPPPVPAPVALSGNLTNDATPSLSWAAGGSNSDAQFYELEVDLSPSFNSAQLRRFEGISATEQSVVPQLNDGVWYFRVRALDVAGNISAWSTAESFMLDTVAPDVPVGNYLPDPSNDPRPLFSWNAIVTAHHYRVQIASDATFNAPLIDENNIAGISFRPAADLGAGAIFWRVASVDVAGNQSVFSQPRFFTIDTSAPTPPVADTIATPTKIKRPLFTWGAVEGITKYRIQISTSDLFTSLVVNDAAVTTTSFTPPADLNDSLYYWRVASIDPAQNESGYSQTQAFVIDTSAPPAPTLVAYPSPSNDLTPTLQWLNPGAGAVLYDLQVLQGTTTLVNATALTQLSYTPTSPLSPQATTWKVRATDAAGNTGSWSTAGSFTLTSAATWRLKALGDRPNIPAGYLREHTDGTFYAFPWINNLTGAPSVYENNEWSVRSSNSDRNCQFGTPSSPSSNYCGNPTIGTDGIAYNINLWGAKMSLHSSSAVTFWTTTYSEIRRMYYGKNAFLKLKDENLNICWGSGSQGGAACLIFNGTSFSEEDTILSGGVSPWLVGMSFTPNTDENNLLIYAATTGQHLWLKKVNNTWETINSANLYSALRSDQFINWRPDAFRFTSDGRPIISTSSVDKDYVWNGSEFQYVTAVEPQGKTISTGTTATQNTALEYFDGSVKRTFPIEEDSGSVLTDPWGETMNNRFGLPVGVIKYIDTTETQVVPFVRLTSVDVAPNIGKHNSLAFTSNGTPRIAYYDAAAQKLKLAEKIDGNWTTSMIDNGTSVGKHASLAMKSNGKGVIAYFDDATADLKIATEGTSNWITETIDSTGDVGRNASLALGSDDHPRIAYYDATNGSLKFARFDGTQWQFETVDASSNDVGRAISLALDASNNPRIAYYDATAGSLRYASFDGTAWSISVVDSSTDAGTHLSMSLKSNGYPMIAYYDATNADLKFAEWSGTDWSISSLRTDGDVGTYVSLTTDNKNEPHLTYYDATNKKLMYGNRDTNWAFRSIDGDEAAGDDRGQWTSIKLNPTNQSPSAAYYDVVEGGVRFVEGMVLY